MSLLRLVQGKRLDELEKLYKDEQVTRKRLHNAMEEMKGKVRVHSGLAGRGGGKGMSRCIRAGKEGERRSVVGALSRGIIICTAALVRPHPLPRIPASTLALILLALCRSAFCVAYVLC